MTYFKTFISTLETEETAHPATSFGVYS